MKVLLALFLGFSVLFGVVDINTASKDELSSVKGIGAKKADAIIAYRTNKCFKTVDDLRNVKGFGVKFIEKHRAELSATNCK